MIITKTLLRKELIQVAKQHHLMKTLIFMIGILTTPEFHNRDRNYTIGLLNGTYKDEADFIDTLKNWQTFIEKGVPHQWNKIEYAYGNHENIYEI